MFRISRGLKERDELLVSIFLVLSNRFVSFNLSCGTQPTIKYQLSTMSKTVSECTEETMYMHSMLRHEYIIQIIT